MILIILALLILWLLWGNSALQLTTYTVTSDRLPDAFDGYRIAQVSDLHNAEMGKDNQKLLSVLAETDPDLIVITGDLIDSSHTDIDMALHFVCEAVKLAPCYYVPGNHEAWVAQDTYHQLENGLKEAGVTVLRQEALQIQCQGQAIAIGGVDDPAFHPAAADLPFVSGRDSYASAHGPLSPEAFDGLLHSKDTFTILLSHRPEYFDSYVAADIDLVFTGHAHGGQFRLPILGGLVAPDQGLFPQYDAGLFTEGNTHMVVSRGIGNSIIPLRIGNRPELILVILGIRE